MNNGRKTGTAAVLEHDRFCSGSTLYSMDGDRVANKSSYGRRQCRFSSICIESYAFRS